MGGQLGTMVMSDIKAITDYLRRYNAWRRGEDERTMDEAGIVPAELGQMIDAAVGLLEQSPDRAKPIGYSNAAQLSYLGDTEAVGEITTYPHVGVKFYENTDFGTALPEGTKLFTRPPKTQDEAEPDMFWDANACELGAEDEYDLADNCAQDLPYGESRLVDVLCAKKLPNRQMRVWADNENEETQWEWAQPPQEGSGDA